MKPSFRYLYRTFNKLFRSENEPFHSGSRVELPEVSVEVLSIGTDGLPTEVRFDFAVALEDTSLHWLRWNWKPVGFGGYVPFDIPAVGETVTLPGYPL
jgi:hypothetical protein